MHSLVPESSQNYSNFSEVMIELYGNDMELVTEDVFGKIVEFVSKIDVLINIKNMNRLVVWL